MLSTKQPSNSNHQESKLFDLEDRARSFAIRVRHFLQALPKTAGNHEYGRQLIRSAGSIGANYIEANEALGKKDFAHRNRIARKEAKESKHWLLLLETQAIQTLDRERDFLVDEAQQFVKIFSAIINKSRV